MKQRIFLLLFAAFQLAATTARADEGMWLLHMLQRINEAEMQQMGLNLSAEDIYSLNQACLKDAVITLNGGSCTAEIISDQGLVLTNHHCAYGAIQGFSTVEDDILTNGFWAMSLDEEKPIPDFSVTFLQRIEDVTERVLADVTSDMDDSDREAAIQAVISQIEEEEKGISPDFRPQIKSFYHGNEFYLFVYRDYTDIRSRGQSRLRASESLVATPTTGCGRATPETSPAAHLFGCRRKPCRLTAKTTSPIPPSATSRSASKASKMETSP